MHTPMDERTRHAALVMRHYEFMADLCRRLGTPSWHWRALARVTGLVIVADDLELRGHTRLASFVRSSGRAGLHGLRTILEFQRARGQ